MTHIMRRLQGHFQAMNDVRRGVCLLNAGRYGDALVAFSRASIHRADDESLAACLAACYYAAGDANAAVRRLDDNAGSRNIRSATRIRRAIALWSAGRTPEAIDGLRGGIAADPECAEMHFQLGTLLTESNEFEEAELRYAQAHNIDRKHTDALVAHAMCCAIRNAPAEALAYLQQAQKERPDNVRIAVLLAQAAKAAKHQGHAVKVRAAMPASTGRDDHHGIDRLSRIIEDDPDFVSAFLSIPKQEVDPQVYRVLLSTISVALERQPVHAELHYHCGRVLEKLGRDDEAIDANERAVGIDPKMTRALIELGKLYGKTDRKADATTRLERAVAAGAEYADVYYLLGNLYRDQGQVGRARTAYRKALTINSRYLDARQALEALTI